tara:strand:- start:2214 stop:2465 length:252 start_codon:yes stop_codon:yes gene_type:complete
MNKGIKHIRSWIRTNGDLSEDGKSITYNCRKIEQVIAEGERLNIPPVIEFINWLSNDSDWNIVDSDDIKEILEDWELHKFNSR